MRILNKYHNETLIEYLGHFKEFIKDSINNLRSGISKNALMFTLELFENSNLITNSNN